MAAEIKTILNIIKMADYKAQHAAEKSKVKKYFFFYINWAHLGFRV
jgi:hypothetical protein